MSSKTNGKLTGRLAIVTGASRRQGIGAAICRALAAEGAHIFFTHWTSYDHHMPWGGGGDQVAELTDELRSMGVRCEAYETDLSRPEAPREVLNEAVNRLGPPMILVNNAAHSVNDDYQTVNAASIDAHYAVNVRASLLLSALFARGFRAGRGGRIINLTSGQSLGPMPGEISYVASKGAIEAFTKSLAAEVGEKGITVNAVDPGPNDTGWMSPELKEQLLPRFPMGRLGMPTDVARVVAFLASDDADWISGQVIHANGGFCYS